MYMMYHFHLFWCYAVSSSFLTNPHGNYEFDKTASISEVNCKLGNYTSACCKGGKNCNFGALRVNNLDFLWRTTDLSLICINRKIRNVLLNVYECYEWVMRLSYCCPLAWWKTVLVSVRTWQLYKLVAVCDSLVKVI